MYYITWKSLKHNAIYIIYFILIFFFILLHTPRIRCSMFIYYMTISFRSLSSLLGRNLYRFIVDEFISTLYYWLVDIIIVIIIIIISRFTNIKRISVWSCIVSIHIRKSSYRFILIDLFIICELKRALYGINCVLRIF